MLMNKPRLILIVLSILIISTIQSANATTIAYDINNISGNTWEYAYTVTNDTLGIDIEEFTIYFGEGLYENLVVGSTPVSWDPIVIDPDSQIPDDGFYDALALTGGITSGASLGGFSVQFDYLGTGTPGVQWFDIVDPDTFFAIDSGITQLVAVPLPATVWLLVSGMLALFGAGASSRTKK